MLNYFLTGILYIIPTFEGSEIIWYNVLKIIYINILCTFTNNYELIDQLFLNMYFFQIM